MSAMNLSTLMREVGEALRLDNESNEKEAYKKYIICIHAIASNLMQALKAQGGEVVVDLATVKQVKLAHRCTERISELITTLASSTATAPQVPATVQTRQPSPPLSSSLHSGIESRPPGAAQSVHQEPANTSLPYQSPHSVPSSTTTAAAATAAPVHHQNDLGQADRFSAPVPALPPENNPHAVVARKSRTMTPMEKASKQNQSLMAAYKARMLRLNRSDFSAFNYSLTIQRKMAENIAIAKAQEEELARKMQARNQRLEQEAAKRFATPTGMSEEEQEQREMYKNILEYENEAIWLKQWRAKLAERPEDPVLICQLVQEVLRCSDHPITELLRQFQFRVYQKLFPLVENRAQQLAQVKVPFAEELWPAYEDVRDIVGDDQDRWEPSETLETPDDKDTGDSLNSTSKPRSSDPSPELETESVTEVDRTGREPDTTPCQKIEKDRENSRLSDDKTPKDSRLGESESCVSDAESVVTCDNISSNELQDRQAKDNETAKANQTTPVVTSHHDERGNTASEANETAPGKSMKSPQTAEISWERRQAQLLMRQVTRGYSRSDEDDDLDYLFDDSNEDAVSDSEEMYASIAYMPNPLEREKEPASGTNEPTEGQADPAEGEITAQGNRRPSRSVSHDFQPPQPPRAAESGAMFRSLPPGRLSPSSSSAEAEEAKRVARLGLEACERHLKSISEDIHCYLDKLLVLMTIAYEPLDTPVGKDQCAVSLEEPFFKPIWKTLLQLFRWVNSRQEQVLACVMTQYSSSTPGDLKVNRKLWLTEDSGYGSAESSSSPSRDSAKQPNKPYGRVVAELRRVGDHYTMLSKLECVVKVCRLICECVDDHYSKSQQEGGRQAPSIGADDLLPILCYVVIQSAMPQLASECQAMAEFIHEGYLMGEEGYCLTTLRTAINYVTSLYPKS